jgi:hypothetical protein
MPKRSKKDRGYQHSAKSQNASVIGQGYSTIAWLPPFGGSWALPLRHERITSFESPISKAVWQFKQVCSRIKQKALVVLDCEYGNGSFVSQTAGMCVSILMRIRSNCGLYAQPEPYSGKGRPKKHGSQFKLNNSATQWKADQVVEIQDCKWGLI